MTRDVPIESKEKFANILLSQAPKYGYNSCGSPEALSDADVRQELAGAKLTLSQFFPSHDCRLPQGSPASQIIFLLAIESLLNLSPKRYGYEDDVAFVAFALSLTRCS